MSGHALDATMVAACIRWRAKSVNKGIEKRRWRRGKTSGSLLNRIPQLRPARPMPKGNSSYLSESTA
jgi:hypothetical protein